MEQWPRVIGKPSATPPGLFYEPKDFPDGYLAPHIVTVEVLGKHTPVVVPFRSGLGSLHKIRKVLREQPGILQKKQSRSVNASEIP